jgi:hypothetical protein
MTRSITYLIPLFSALLCAQTETGQITGTVADRSGRAVSLATISASSKLTGFTRQVRASGKGLYNMAALPPGNYTVEVSAEGFAGSARDVPVGAGVRIGVDFVLQGKNSPTVQTQTQGQLLLQNEMQDLPNLTRNAYQFAELAGNVSDAGLGTRGAGLAIDGQRESSTNVMLDGADNNNEFAGSIGQLVPLDAVSELSVLTSDFTAEYGRASGGMVSLAGRSGGSALHGAAYEFNRVSRLTSNSFQDNADGLREPGFDRNQFGYAVGGPAIRNKLFFFSSTEGTRVRSEATVLAWVPTPQLLAQTPANTQAFFQNLGQLRSGAQTLGTVTLSSLTALSGENPCTGLACATLPAGLPLFSHVAYQAPADSGGGFPQNTWNTYERVDYNLSDRTQIYARYGLYSENDLSGVLSNSPYSNYDLGQSQFDNTFLASITHSWNDRWISQTKLDFNRFTIEQQGLTSRGVVPTMYANPVAPVAIGSDNVAFPGYNPFSPGSGGAFGGPQNTLQLQHDVSWTKGSHLIRFGGSYEYVRDNRTDAAYQTAVDSLSYGGGLGAAVNGLLSGQFAQIEVAVNPQGKLPCAANAPASSCSLTLPVSAPNFSRSNRFNEGALYAQDYWKPRRRLAVNLGVRWEHFGVQHNGNPKLDSNWYAPGVRFADNSLGAYLRNGGLQPASGSPVGGLWKPDWKDFAPRVGVAWDVFGDGRTTLRGGYGIGYDRNFGNVTFNVIQNLPNYAVLDVPGAITTNNFGPLSGSGGTLALPEVGARIIDPYLKTAYAHFWSAAVRHEFARSIVYSAEYSGSKGVNLYNVSYPNQIGFGNLALGDPCTGTGDCTSQPNANYGEDVGYRGNQGFSIYHSLNNRFTMNNFLNSGVMLTVNYTWSHAIDNISSTFFEAGGQGVASQYGSQNITINNGDFDLGLLDPYNPKLDRGDAEFDIRHRVTLSGNWQVPAWKKSGWMGTLMGGWSVNPVFLARSGQPFSVFDSNAQTLDLNIPRATFVGSFPLRRNSFVATPNPDLYQIITFLPSQIAHEPNPLLPGDMWPSNMSGRDLFRAPGFWNFDLAVLKNTKITERFSLQLRAELFNVFNHANLYVIGTSADVGAGNTVNACFGCSGSTYDRRQTQLAAKFIF